jgi:hypothetical protein
MLPFPTGKIERALIDLKILRGTADPTADSGDGAGEKWFK